MARKGTAKIKPPKSVFLTDSESDGGDDELRLDGTARERTKKTGTAGEHFRGHDAENVDPDPAREQLNLPKAPKEGRNHGRQPRQELGAVEQSKTLAGALLNPIQDTEQLPTLQSPRRQNPRSKKKKSHQQRSVSPSRAAANVFQHSLTENLTPPTATRPPQRQNTRPYTTPYRGILEENVDMAIPGGAAIPANQQRNMRACMVCSIVRTQQQFMTSGCPNCEDILELAGNSEQVNDCTSQVFEGLITVADTKKSWVARYQRLEGYVPGVYATQVEGILPEEVIVAVENAGINYVPRDGSEQEMLPKD